MQLNSATESCLQIRFSLKKIAAMLNNEEFDLDHCDLSSSADRYLTKEPNLGWANLLKYCCIIGS